MPVGQSWSNFMCSITGVGKGCIRFWGRLDQNSGFHGNQKPPLTYNGKNDVSTFSRLFSMLFRLAGNENMHKISDEYEFWPDRTTDYGVSCPWASKKFAIGLWWENAVSMLARSFLIESSSKLLETRTGKKARTSLVSGGIKLLTLELLALEWRKFCTFELEYLCGQLANLDQILCVASLGVGKGCIIFWSWLDKKTGVHGNRKPPLTYNGENDVSTFSQLLLIRSFLYLQLMRTCIKSRTSSNFGQVGPLTTELAALERLKNFP